MEIEIVVFKESGKYYTSSIVRHEENIPLWEDSFKSFVRDNIPAKLGEVFVVVNNLGDGFHTHLWKYNQLFRS